MYQHEGANPAEDREDDDLVQDSLAAITCPGACRRRRWTVQRSAQRDYYHHRLETKPCHNKMGKLANTYDFSSNSRAAMGDLRASRQPLCSEEGEEEEKR